MTDDDVVDLLVRQHERIRSLFTEVENAAPEDKAAAFQRLVRLLAVHETAEEEIVHPYARRKAGHGDDLVDERLAEENAAKDMLTQMERAGVDDPQFAANLATLRKAVVEHAEAEEREEFPTLRRAAGERERHAMALGVKAAEAIAPTHPHAGVETAPKNLLAGPPVAIMDRARDVIRKAMGRA
ncbi:hemerythrin domain-containing protein [Nonomuraea spiralis]|uniref:Hemerythrin domain-containing protein n=1 Tax=Nonomuraea spiralis TaxID=46182 RepID=A0ABV5I5X4_9ACTN|nr:hemerythrin domain-containing protein [Nonomuraea spiralis]GGS64630.1 hemerythrin [Nonomuraea spiralis]